jgi:CCR4-NOT transcription complex subunit 6
MTVDFAQVAIQRADFAKSNDMFDRLLTRDNLALIALLENRLTGTKVIVANAHLYWDPLYRDVKLIQTAILVETLKDIAQWFQSVPPHRPPLTNGDATSASLSLQQQDAPTYEDWREIPLIVSGDFNSVPGSGVYDFLAEGRVPSNHPDFMDYVYGKFTADGLKHEFGLRSAYADVAEFSLTNYVPSFEGVLDYIWYNTQALGVNRVLGEVDHEYLSRTVGFPNAHFPSE